MWVPSPSLTEASPLGPLMTGATLLTVDLVLFSVSLPPSPSLTVTLTVTVWIARAGVIGPGALERAGLGGVVEAVGIEGQLRTAVPLVPQLGAAGVRRCGGAGVGEAEGVGVGAVALVDRSVTVGSAKNDTAPRC